MEQLTIANVTNPSLLQVDDSILGKALSAKAESAQQAYVEFAVQVLNTYQAARARLLQRKVALQKEIDDLTKAEDRLNKAQAASTTEKGLFPLCAELDMKSEAMDFAASNGLVVPASSDSVWNV